MSQERIISPVLKAMIDTMVFDRLLDEPTAVQAVSQAVRDGRLALFTTHVQEDQIAAVPDPLRRKRLQALPREVIPSSVFIVGSRGSITRRLARVTTTPPFTRAVRNTSPMQLSLTPRGHDATPSSLRMLA